MAKTDFAQKADDRRAAELQRVAGYRAVNHGAEHEWAVVDGRGSVVFRGDARVAAMVASRLTRPSP